MCIGLIRQTAFRRLGSELRAPAGTDGILLLRALIPVLQGNNGYAGSYEKINPANDRVLPSEVVFVRSGISERTAQPVFGLRFGCVERLQAGKIQPSLRNAG